APSALPEDEIDDPAAAGVRPRPAAVGQDLLVSAAGLLERVCQKRHVVEPAFLVSRAGEGDGCRCLPSGVQGKGAERVAYDAAQKTLLCRLLVGRRNFPDGFASRTADLELGIGSSR